MPRSSAHVLILTATGPRRAEVTADADEPAARVAEVLSERFGSPLVFGSAPGEPWHRFLARVTAPLAFGPRDRPAAAPSAGNTEATASTANTGNTGDTALRLSCLAGPDAGWRYALRPGRWSIGRDPSCDITLADPHLARQGAELEVGPSRLVLHQEGQTPRSLTVGEHFVLGGSVVGLYQGEAARQPAGTAVIELPAAPEPERARPLGLLGMLAPLVAAGIMVAVTQSWTFMLFCLMSPLTGLASWWAERRRVRRRTAAATRQWRSERAGRLTEAEHIAAGIAAARTAALEESFGHGPPDDGELRLWLGIGDDRGPLVLTGPEGENEPSLPPGGIGHDLRTAPLLIHGPADRVRALLRGVLPGLPAGVTIRLERGTGHLQEGSPDPETSPDASRALPDVAVHALHDDVPARAATTTAIPPERPVPPLLNISTTADAHGLRVLLTAADGGTVRPAPAKPRHAEPGVAPVTVTCGPGETTLRRPGQKHSIPFLPLQAPVAAFHARMLARAALPGRTDPRPPGAVALGSMLPLDEDSLRRRWAAGGTTRFPLGTGHSGTCTVDLAAQGPHALIGGTTGSGKSQLLETLVVSLCAVNSPRHLSVLLIDYKGGAAFSRCKDLPHVSGLVTDLDAHETSRALSALTAELQRRERLLAQAGAHDIDTYNRRAPEPMPRLLIVVDEYRALALALPRLVDGLVSLAALGRSLGMHLVLATQRPAGIVTQDMRANLSLRIALRVRDRNDSLDVLESDAAVRIPASAPGRGFLRSDGAPETSFHAALLDPPAHPGADEVLVRELAPQEFRPGTVRRVAADAATAFDAGAFHRAAGGHRAAPIWLPPLPERIHDGEATGLLPTDQRGQTPFAVADDPARQRRRALTLETDAAGHLLALGAARSGRSGLIRTIVRSLPGTATYLIDPGRQLADLAEAPHVLGWCTAEDPWRIGRMLDALAGEVARRRAGRSGPRGADSADSTGPMLIVIDGWESFTVLDSGPGQWTERVLALARAAPGLGVRLLLTGERRLASAAVAGAIPDRIILRMADPQDAVLLGVPAAEVPERMPPGRALFLGTDAEGARSRQEVQIVTTAGSRSELARPFPDLPVFRPLPVSVLAPSDEHAHRPDDPESPGGGMAAPYGRVRLPLGIGGDRAERFDYEPAVHGSCLLVAGHPGTGRSTVLRRALRAFGRGDRMAVLGGDLPGALPLPGFTARLADLPPGSLIVADDYDVQPRELEHALTARLRTQGEVPDLMLVSSALGAGFSSLAGQLRARGPVLLLGTRSGADGELIGRRDLPPLAGPPGRGWLALRGRLEPLQLYAP